MMFLSLPYQPHQAFCCSNVPRFLLFFSSERCHSSPTSVDVIAVPTTSYPHPCCAQTGLLLPINNSGCRVLYIVYFFVSLLSLCHLCFCLLQRPFSVHAQLRHAVTHHSAFFLQQRFNEFTLFHPLAFPAASRKPLCVLLLLFKLSFHFCLSTLLFVQPRNTWPTALPSFLSAFQPQSLFHRAFSQSTSLHGTSNELFQ